MRLCVIGNSHVAALKSAWDQISHEYSKFTLTFFASRGDNFKYLEVSNNQLVPTSSKLLKNMEYTSGIDNININSYDLFLIYGLGFRIQRLGLHYSNSARRCASEDLLRKTLCYITAKKIRNITDKYIYIGTSPQLADSKKNEELLFIRYKECIDLFSSINEISNSEIVAQPEETLVNGFYTNPIFTTHSKALDVGDAISNQPHKSDDISHMNFHYGIVWLQNFFNNYLKFY